MFNTVESDAAPLVDTSMNENGEIIENNIEQPSTSENEQTEQTEQTNEFNNENEFSTDEMNHCINNHNENNLS